jgi:hypothetical protein
VYTSQPPAATFVANEPSRSAVTTRWLVLASTLTSSSFPPARGERSAWTSLPWRLEPPRAAIRSNRTAGTLRAPTAASAPGIRGWAGISGVRFKLSLLIGGAVPSTEFGGAGEAGAGATVSAVFGVTAAPAGGAVTAAPVEVVQHVVTGS